MKKTIEHGKVWLIALAISLSSFAYLQTDSKNLDQKQLLAEVNTEQMEAVEENDEFNLMDIDVVKGMTLLVLSVFRMD